MSRVGRMEKSNTLDNHWFVVFIDDVKNDIERLKKLYEETWRVSAAAKSELTQMKNQPEIDKESHREYRRRLKTYRASHDRYVANNMKIFTAGFFIWALILVLFECIAFTLLCETTKYIENYETIVPAVVREYATNYDKDMCVWIVSAARVIGVKSEITEFFMKNLATDEINQGFRHRAANSTMITIGVFALLTLGRRYSRKKKAVLWHFSSAEYEKGLKIPLLTPENSATQKEMDKIAKKLSRQKIPALIKMGNKILRAEYSAQNMNQEIMGHMHTIVDFQKSVRKLTLRGRIISAHEQMAAERKARYASSSSGGGDILAMLGIAVLACVGFAAAVSAPQQYTATWSDGSKTTEWH